MPKFFEVFHIGDEKYSFRRELDPWSPKEISRLAVDGMEERQVRGVDGNNFLWYFSLGVLESLSLQASLLQAFFDSLFEWTYTPLFLALKWLDVHKWKESRWKEERNSLEVKNQYELYIHIIHICIYIHIYIYIMYLIYHSPNQQYQINYTKLIIAFLF